MEGEGGANPHALEEIRWTIARFWLVGFLPSGAGLEGAGKNSMGGHLGYLLDRHRAPIYEGAGSKSFQPLLLGMKSARNHVARWLPSRQTPIKKTSFPSRCGPLVYADYRHGHRMYRSMVRTSFFPMAILCKMLT